MRFSAIIFGFTASMAAASPSPNYDTPAIDTMQILVSHEGLELFAKKCALQKTGTSHFRTSEKHASISHNNVNHSNSILLLNSPFAESDKLVIKAKTGNTKTIINLPVSRQYKVYYEISTLTITNESSQTFDSPIMRAVCKSKKSTN